MTLAIVAVITAAVVCVVAALAAAVQAGRSYERRMQELQRQEDAIRKGRP
ncbi:hypothetical protein OG762_36675 [Streptomyces sp. NBC_01136]|nr:hypothetical protein OG762_36675 [Streptomyces sp. NBC_01136]